MRELKSSLGDDWLLLTNIPQYIAGKEIDVCLLGPPGMIVMELKNHRGPIIVPKVGDWTGLREGGNPLQQAVQCSQRLKRYIAERDATLQRVFIDFLVLMTNISCELDVHVDLRKEFRVGRLSEAENLVYGRLSFDRKNRGITLDDRRSIFSIITGQTLPPKLEALWSTAGVPRVGETRATATELHRPANILPYETEKLAERRAYDSSSWLNKLEVSISNSEAFRQPTLNTTAPSYVDQRIIQPRSNLDLLIPNRFPPNYARSRRTSAAKPVAIILALLIVIAIPTWAIYRVIVGVEAWWSGLPNFAEIARTKFPRVPNPWHDTPKTQTTLAERKSEPFPKRDPNLSNAPDTSTSVSQQFPIPQNNPAVPPPPVPAAGCPIGTLFDSYTGQCTFLPGEDQATSVGAPLDIHPECSPGSVYSSQYRACVLVEANNDCPLGMHYREESRRCVSKLKYGPLRYEDRVSLLAGSFVQAHPVPENYAIRVLQGSLRIFYVEDPATAENVVLSGRGQPLYNYAIISCVICPATFITRRIN